MKYITLLFLSVFFFTTAHSQVIVTVAGTGVGGYSGDGGPATDAKMSDVYALAFDKQGNFYFSDDANPRVRKVTPAGMISLVAGSGVAGYGGDGGPAIYAAMGNIYGIAVDTAGGIYLADGGNARIRKITPDGIIHTIAGTGLAGYNGDGIPASNAQLNGPASVAVDDTGNVYICDNYNYRIRKINAAGVISTVAGNGVAGFTADGAKADTSAIDINYCVVIDGDHNILFKDKNRIRKIEASTGLLTTLAGNGIIGFSGDGGPATDAAIHSAQFTVDSVGNLFLGEGSNRIRKVNTEGTINTIAGTGLFGMEGDGINVLTAKVNSPFGVAFSPVGELHFCDRSARIRKITLDWTLMKEPDNSHDLIEIFPNPAGKSISVKITASTNEAIITITNVEGKEIDRRNARCGETVTFETAWPPGIYTLHVQAGEKVYTRQVTIK